MSIQTELARITSAKTSIVAAIEGKGVTVPDGTLLDGMATLIESIETGGGGDIKIEQGSVTFAETQTNYSFVTDSPDIFIAYVEDDSNPEYSSSKYIWMMIQDTRLFKYYGLSCQTFYVFGYNKGMGKYYTPYKSPASTIGVFNSGDFNGILGAKTYKWYAIYGVTAT